MEPSPQHTQPGMAPGSHPWAAAEAPVGLRAGGAPVLSPAHRAEAVPHIVPSSHQLGETSAFSLTTCAGEPTGLLDCKSFEMFQYDIFSHTAEIISILISLCYGLARGCYLRATWLNHLYPTYDPIIDCYFLYHVYLCLQSLLLFLTFFHPPTNTLIIFVRRHLCYRQQIPTAVPLCIMV